MKWTHVFVKNKEDCYVSARVSSAPDYKHFASRTPVIPDYPVRPLLESPERERCCCCCIIARLQFILRFCLIMRYHHHQSPAENRENMSYRSDIIKSRHKQRVHFSEILTSTRLDWVSLQIVIFSTLGFSPKKRQINYLIIFSRLKTIDKGACNFYLSRD